MRKLALILATTALFGMTAPAFAVEAGSSAQARTPVAQANGNTTVKAKDTVMAKAVHHRRGVNKRTGPGYLNRNSASISGASPEVRLPSGEAAS
jgi:hypothetical protein